MTTIEQYGVWCHQDHAFCQDTIGTKEFADSQLEHWASGKAANVDPKHFTYEVRPVPLKQLNNFYSRF